MNMSYVNPLINALKECDESVLLHFHQGKNRRTYLVGYKYSKRCQAVRECTLMLIHSMEIVNPPESEELPRVVLINDNGDVREADADVKERAKAHGLIVDDGP